MIESRYNGPPIVPYYVISKRLAIGGSVFRGWNHEGPCWESKADDALKFYDRESADKFAGDDPEDVRIEAFNWIQNPDDLDYLTRKAFEQYTRDELHRMDIPEENYLVRLMDGLYKIPSVQQNFERFSVVYRIGLGHAFNPPRD